MSQQQQRKPDKLVVGVVSYGGGLVGWVREGQDGDFEKKFAVRHHTGSVRSIAAVSRPQVMSAKARSQMQSGSKAKQMRLESNARAFMATGGQDETIQLYDLTKLKILGNLHQHNHEVTALAFFRSKNLLSGDADGILNVWRCYDWQLLESMTGHKGRINSVSIHPTGAMALTSSADKTVKLWNLLKCRCASTMKFPEEKMVVAWSPSGDTYAILGRRDIEVWSAQTSKRIALLKHRGTTYTGRTNTFVYLSDEVIVTGGDESILRAYSTTSGEELSSVDSLQKSRIRSLTVTDDSAAAAKGRFNLFAAFSNGNVQSWEAQVDEEDGALEVNIESLDDLSTGGERLVGVVTCVMTSAQDGASGSDDGESTAAESRNQSKRETRNAASGEEPQQPATGTKNKKKKKKRKRKAAAAAAESEASPASNQKVPLLLFGGIDPEGGDDDDGDADDDSNNRTQGSEPAAEDTAPSKKAKKKRNKKKKNKNKNKKKAAASS